MKQQNRILSKTQKQKKKEGSIMATELTDRKALLESRASIIKSLVSAIQIYHNLSFTDVIGTHGLKGHIVPMGNANYLRYLAYANEARTWKNHFLTENEALKEGLSIKPDAKPLILERWTVDKDKKYHCFELPVYNISDLDGPTSVLNSYRGRNLPEPFQPSGDGIARLFENAGVLPKGAPRDAETFTQAVRAYAEKVLPGREMEQKHFLHLFQQMSQNRLNQPIYTEDDAKLFQEEPNLLFSTFSTASKAMRHTQEELRFIEKQLEREKEEHVARLVEEEKTQPLASLRVTYHWSEAPDSFTDKDGKPFPSQKDIELTGEDAYRFLVQANRADKRKFHAHEGYDKTVFSFAFGDTELGSDRYDLGDPCFNNQKSIAKAMESHMAGPYQYYLNNNDALLRHFNVLKEFNGEELRNNPDYASPEAYRAKLQKNVEELHVFWQAFAKKEQAFLQEHPEYEKINQEDAELYIAICPISEYEVAKASGMVMETVPKDELHDFVACEPSAWKVHQAVMVIAKDYTQEEELRELKNLSGYVKSASIPEGFIAFKTAISPASGIWDNHRDAEKYPVGLSYVIPKEQVEKLQCLEDISLTWSSYKPAKEQSPKYPPQTSTSLHALRNFEIAVKQDDQIYEEALSERVYVPGTFSQNNLTVSVKGEPIYQISYRNGRGELAKAAPNYLSPELPERYKEAVEIYQRYEKDSNRVLGKDRTYASSPDADRPFPTVEESYKNFEEHYFKKPEKTPRLTIEWREDALKYYVNHPLVDPAIDTPEKAVLATISEMAKDGYTEARIKSVLENDGTTRHREEAIALLKSPEGKKAIRQARKERDEAETIHKTADKAH